MPKQSKFWDRISKRYARSPVPDQAVYQQKLEITREYFTPECQVMEFGCGTGATAVAHAPYVKHIQAIDFSDRMLEYGRRNAIQAGVENITFSRSGIDDYSAADQSFDVIMGHSILHLLPSKEKVLVKVYKLLKPGGVLVTSTTCIGHARILQLVLPVGHFFGLLPTVRFFTTDELAAAFVDAGYLIEHRWQPDDSDAVFIVAKRPL